MKNTLLILLAIVSVGLALMAIHKYRSGSKNQNTGEQPSVVYTGPQQIIDPNYDPNAEFA